MGEPFYSVNGPLDALPAQQQMRAANFRGWPALVRSLGGNPRSILDRCGLDFATMRDPDCIINCQSLVDVLEHCSQALDEPLFGLRLAQLQEPDVYGCVTAQCRAAATVRQAVQCFIDYIPVVHAPACKMHLEKIGQTAEIRWSACTDSGQNDQANYQATALNLKLFRLICGPNFRPSYINLVVHADSKDTPEIEHVFGCRFNANSASNAIAFPSRFLDQPVASADKVLFSLLGGYLDRVKAASRTTIKERAEDYVRGALPTGACSIERCARQLGMSVRMLQFQLGDLGVKFSDVLQEQRIELAKSLLREGQHSLDEAATLLGYSEQSAFGRAFKRYTGSTPGAYRAGSRAK